jgi:hypothetical protein
MEIIRDDIYETEKEIIEIIEHFLTKFLYKNTLPAENFSKNIMACHMICRENNFLSIENILPKFDSLRYERVFAFEGDGIDFGKFHLMGIYRGLWYNLGGIYLEKKGEEYLKLEFRPGDLSNAYRTKAAFSRIALGGPIEEDTMLYYIPSEEGMIFNKSTGLYIDLKYARYGLCSSD